MMKIGVSAYSFNRYVNDNKITLAEIVKKAAELGFDGFEMLPRYFNAQKSSAGEAKELRRMLADAGLTLSCYTLGNDFGLPDPRRRAEIDRIRAEVDIALFLGVRTCRIEAAWGVKPPDAATYEEAYARVVAATKEVAEYALKCGVKLGVENHGRYMSRCAQILQLIKDVNSPAYGANPDIGNWLAMDDDPLASCRELAQYTFHVHAKDFRRRPPEPSQGAGWGKSVLGWQIQGAVVGEGDVPVQPILQAFKSQGYDGFLSLEHESPEDPIEGMRRSLANLRQMVAALK